MIVSLESIITTLLDMQSMFPSQTPACRMTENDLGELGAMQYLQLSFLSGQMAAADEIGIVLSYLSSDRAQSKDENILSVWMDRAQVRALDDSYAECKKAIGIQETSACARLYMTALCRALDTSLEDMCEIVENAQKKGTAIRTPAFAQQ